MHERFHFLAAKVLAAEASPDERSELDALLVADPALRAEFSDLQLINKTVAEFAPLASALDSPEAAIPAERSREFEKAYRQKFGRSLETSTQNQRPAKIDLFSWLKAQSASVLLASGAIALIALVFLVLSLSNRNRSANQRSSLNTVAYLLPDQGEVAVRYNNRDYPAQKPISLKPGDELIVATNARAILISPEGRISLTGPRQIPAQAFARLASSPSPATDAQNKLALALFTSRNSLSNSPLLLATRASIGIPIYSPLGATASLTPIFLWKAEPNKTYDLHITDELNPKTPPWEALAARPSLQFDQQPGWRGRPFASNNLYRLTITETGHPGTASTYTFRTTEQTSEIRPQTEAAKLLNALNILSGTSGRTGDALSDLLGLGEPLASSELVLRLELLAFGQAGYSEEFHSTFLRLVQPPDPSSR